MLERPFSDREKYLEQRLAQIEEQFKAFQEQLKITSEGAIPKTRGYKNQYLSVNK